MTRLLLQVFCDKLQTKVRTLLMNRNQGDVSFNKDWQAYKVGFGNLSGDHWLGLEHMHLLTENRRYTLRYVIQYMHLCHGKQALHTVRP